MTVVHQSSPGSESASEHRAQEGDIVAVAAGGAINATAGMINAGLSFLFTVLVARELGAGEAGALFEAIAVFSVLELTSELGAVTAIVRSVSRHKALHHVRGLRLTILIASAPSALLACAAGATLLIFAHQFSTLLVRHGDRSAVSEYLRIFALVLPLSAVGDILLGATRGFGTMLPSAAIDLIIKPAVRVSLLFAIVQVSHSPVIVAVGWAAPIVLSLALAAGSLHLLLRNSGEGGSTRPEVEDANVRALASDFWRFALPQSLSGVLQVAVVWVDVVLLGALKSTHDAGTYATLSRYLLVGTLGLSAIALAIAPLMSSLLAEGELSRAGSVYRVVTAWIVASAFPIYFVMAVFSPVLMRLFGGSFSGGAGPLTILSIAMLANIATGPVVMILLMGGRSGLLLVDSGVAFLVNVVLNVMLIPPYGMTGAAIAWSSGILAMNALALLQVRRAWQIHPYGRGLLVIATGASLLYGVLGLVISRVIGMDIAGLIATCLIGSAVYGTALWSARGELQFAVLWGAIRTRRVTAGFESR